ncbi:hypothetical protein HCN44_004788 [Aphidius gifuensis]|uniref:Uncharacterized protein n=1 Tax=Aphidius gifuensis TaxID=684658 RepID=A0A834XJG1_APHGI|nr:hypothetical protein HCN44_004788 [Aphidius gifuensis]
MKQGGPLRYAATFRSEAVHQGRKITARTAISRKNICYTLAKKYQLVLAKKFVDRKPMNADEMKILITRRSQNLKKLGKPFQPVLVVIGKSWSRIEEVLCCVTAEVKWISENIITGIDIIFKSFFTLDLEYPFESEVHWCIIANLIYKIENTTIHPEAVGVLMNLSTIDKQEVIDFLNEKNNDNDETQVSDD